mmetsp:Transcript_64137/g.178235  ORF Transcript_64137/g.178235 Transcript_64137/m.178235 type:complete len:224 (+) Transcript_64137:349-1020(+)
MPHRSLRRSANLAADWRRLRRRERSLDHRGRGQPHQQDGLQGAFRVRVSQPWRGIEAGRRRREYDPHERRGGNRRHRRGGAPRPHPPQGDPAGSSHGRQRAFHLREGDRRPAGSRAAGEARRAFACREFCSRWRRHACGRGALHATRRRWRFRGQRHLQVLGTREARPRNRQGRDTFQRHEDARGGLRGHRRGHDRHQHGRFGHALGRPRGRKHGARGEADEG